MAKIGNLEVDTINIKHNAVTGIVESTAIPTASCLVPNAVEFAVDCYAFATFTANHTHNMDDSVFTLTISRVRGSVVLDTIQGVSSGTGVHNTFLALSNRDIESEEDDTYQATANAQIHPGGPGGGSSASVVTNLLQCLYTKR